jgi:hypothetical protein
MYDSYYNDTETILIGLDPHCSLARLKYKPALVTNIHSNVIDFPITAKNMDCHYKISK